MLTLSLHYVAGNYVKLYSFISGSDGAEYITCMDRFTKWHHPTRNIAVGEIVLVRDESPLPTKRPLASVIQVHPGKDNLVRVATIKIVAGVYTQPVTKLALLAPEEIHLVGQYQEQVSDFKRKSFPILFKPSYYLALQKNQILSLIPPSLILTSYISTKANFVIKMSSVCGKGSAESITPEGKLLKLPEARYPNIRW